ncbi:hypothetical protein DF947_10620 [Pedobacter paludis]|uniref:Uncharacterized protein n=2 Tax=Pedobacter paludis TaxID=2203212 RepID=A0A317EZD0_9SPHI|nr:hypothetical protein DF947_10620 [Pedobacter paludis]
MIKDFIIKEIVGSLPELSALGCLYEMLDHQGDIASKIRIMGRFITESSSLKQYQDVYAISSERESLTHQSSAFDEFLLSQIEILDPALGIHSKKQESLIAEFCGWEVGMIQLNFAEHVANEEALLYERALGKLYETILHAFLFGKHRLWLKRGERSKEPSQRIAIGVHRKLEYHTRFQSSCLYDGPTYSLYFTGKHELLFHLQMASQLAVIVARSRSSGDPLPKLINQKEFCHALVKDMDYPLNVREEFIEEISSGIDSLIEIYNVNEPISISLATVDPTVAETEADGVFKERVRSIRGLVFKTALLVIFLILILFMTKKMSVMGLDLFAMIIIERGSVLSMMWFFAQVSLFFLLIDYYRPFDRSDILCAGLLMLLPISVQIFQYPQLLYGQFGLLYPLIAFVFALSATIFLRSPESRPAIPGVQIKETENGAAAEVGSFKGPTGRGHENHGMWNWRKTGASDTFQFAGLIAFMLISIDGKDHETSMIAYVFSMLLSVPEQPVYSGLVCAIGLGIICGNVFQKLPLAINGIALLLLLVPIFDVYSKLGFSKIDKVGFWLPFLLSGLFFTMWLFFENLESNNRNPQNGKPRR